MLIRQHVVAAKGTDPHQAGFGTFWTANELDDDYAWRRYLYWNIEAIGRFTDLKGNGYSVRCVQDR